MKEGLIKHIPIFPDFDLEELEYKTFGSDKFFEIRTECLVRLKHTDGKYYLTHCLRVHRFGRPEMEKHVINKSVDQFVAKERKECLKKMITDAYWLTKQGKVDLNFKIMGIGSEPLFMLDPNQKPNPMEIVIESKKKKGFLSWLKPH